MDPWISEAAEAIAARAPRELEALVAVSSPSGDVHGAEEAEAVAAALAPDEATVEHVPCSTPEHAPDLLLRLRGRGTKRLLLLGHVDTVVQAPEHRALTRDGDQLVGSGAVDMKGGVVLALGLLRALARRLDELEEAALLLVCDEEWRVAPFAHAPRFAGWDACLCFEAGQLAGEEEAVVVKRKAAGTIEILAEGRSSHSGSAPEKGANALLALARAAQAVAGRHDPAGPERLSAVPTILSAGDAFNVVPGSGRLVADVRADRAQAFDAVLAGVPEEVGGARLHTRLARVWPAMDARAQTATLLEHASALLGRRVVAGARGGASDASHVATVIPLTIDGLGPRGGGAHALHEYVLESSFLPRAQIALAVAHGVLTA